jgi:hypothetical protein
VQVIDTVTPIEVKGRHLSTGVGTGIRASRKVYSLPKPSEFVQGFFKFALYRSGSRLPLAS